MSDKKIPKFTTRKPFEQASFGNDPCPPSPGPTTYVTPPILYIGFQPRNLEQYDAKEALKYGTLWPIFNDHYKDPYHMKG